MLLKFVEGRGARGGGGRGMNVGSGGRRRRRLGSWFKLNGTQQWPFPHTCSHLPSTTPLVVGGEGSNLLSPPIHSYLYIHPYPSIRPHLTTTSFSFSLPQSVPVPWNHVNPNNANMPCFAASLPHLLIILVNYHTPKVLIPWIFFFFKFKFLFLVLINWAT